MSLEPLPVKETAEIMEHMNQDHSETLANYVRYYGGVKDVISAELKEITHHELYIDTVAHDFSCRLAVQLIKPIKKISEARTILVEMAKQAREGLHQRAKEDK